MYDKIKFKLYIDIELSLNNDFPYEYSLNFELVNKKFNELEMEIKKIKLCHSAHFVFLFRSSRAWCFLTE